MTGGTGGGVLAAGSIAVCVAGVPAVAPATAVPAAFDTVPPPNASDAMGVAANGVATTPTTGLMGAAGTGEVIGVMVKGRGAVIGVAGKTGGGTVTAAGGTGATREIA